MSESLRATPSAVATALDAQNALFASLYREGRIDDMVARFYTDDAIVVPPDQPMVRDAAAIRALFHGYTAHFGEVEMIPLITQVDEAAGFAFQLANATLFERDTRKPVPARYITVWRREVLGWRCVVDFFGFGHLTVVSSV